MLPPKCIVTLTQSSSRLAHPVAQSPNRRPSLPARPVAWPGLKRHGQDPTLRGIPKGRIALGDVPLHLGVFPNIVTAPSVGTPPLREAVTIVWASYAEYNHTMHHFDYKNITRRPAMTAAEAALPYETGGDAA